MLSTLKLFADALALRGAPECRCKSPTLVACHAGWGRPNLFRALFFADDIRSDMRVWYKDENIGFFVQDWVHSVSLMAAPGKSHTYATTCCPCTFGRECTVCSVGWCQGFACLVALDVFTLLPRTRAEV